MPNWKKLIGEGNYIRAVRYLQDTEHTYSMKKEYEKELVEIIEQLWLYEMDDAGS